MRLRILCSLRIFVQFVQFKLVYAVCAIFCCFSSLSSLCSLRKILQFAQFIRGFAQFAQYSLRNLGNFNPGFMQVWLMQLYVRKVRKTASIRVFSKATPIRCAARMPVLPARTRELRAATRFLA